MDDYKYKTRESYNKHAAFHTKRFSGLFDVTKRTEFFLFESLVPGKKILDVGCGGGENARHFMDHGFEVTAIDLSEEMVKLAQEKGVHAEVMDMESIIYSPESFDGIWAVTSLLHLPKHKLPLMVKELHDLLHIKGILYVCMKEGEGESFVKDSVDSTERFFAYWKKDELETLFKPFFETVNYKEETVGSRTFLMFFFRKK